jgi:hypothetical protein
LALLALARGGDSSAPPAAGSLLGYALLLAAVLCEASYVVIGKRLTGNVSPRRISALINLWGLALVTPFGLWQAWSFDFASVCPGTWTLLLFYAHCRQHGDGVAVDAGPAPRAFVARRRLYRDAAGERRAGGRVGAG